jgi:hypothetical protein
MPQRDHDTPEKGCVFGEIRAIEAAAENVIE